MQMQAVHVAPWSNQGALTGLKTNQMSDQLST